MVAKFASVCPCCNVRTIPGVSEIRKGTSGWQHVTCGSAPAATASAARPTYRARRPRTARYCEGWGADNPHAPRPNYTCTECCDDC